MCRRHCHEKAGRSGAMHFGYTQRSLGLCGKSFGSGLAIHLSEGVERMLVKNFCEPPHVVVESRAKFLEKSTSRCKELQEAETKMQEGLDKHVRAVLKGKRLILLGEV